MNFKYKLQILIYPFIIFPVILIILINFFINSSKTKDMQYEILENHLSNILLICETENDIIKRLKMIKDQYYSEAVKRKVLSEIKMNAHKNERIFIVKSKTKELVFFTDLNDDLKEKSLTNTKYVNDMINIKNGRMEFTEQIDVISRKMNIAVYSYYPEWDWLIAVSLSKDNLYRYVYSATYLSVIIAVIFLIILIIILYIISRGISRPLEQLEEGTVKIAQNNYDVNIDIKSSDEFGKIAKKFNIMADKIKEYSINNKKIIKDLQDSEEKYRSLYETMVQGVVYHDSEGKIISANLAAQKMLGLTFSQLQGRSSIDPKWGYIHEDGSVFSGDTHPAMVSLKTGKEIRNVIMGVFNPVIDDYKWIKIDAIPQFLPGENKPYQVFTTFDDITERRHAEEELKISEERYRKAQTIGHVGNWEYNIKTMEFWGSDEVKQIYGFDPDQLNFTTDEVENCIPERERVHQALVDLIEKGKSYNLEFEIHPKNSLESKIITSIAELQHDENGNPLKIIGVIQDITERKEVEARQILSLKILKDLNDKISQENIIKNVLKEIKQSTGFEALSIRLKLKEDFPYYATNGFSENFVIKERYLCSKDAEGNITYDNNGKVLYECLCGYILSEKKTKKKSFITRNGSFWTNNSTILVKKKLLDDLQIKIRGRCIEEGYESIALIPIKSKEEIIGLLQINDHRKDCFTKEAIAFFEGLASSIGIAIGRKNAEEEISKLNRELEKRVKERTIQLEASNKELEAFAYSVSHDLKTPLRSIYGFSQILLEEYSNNVDKRGKDYLERVRSAAQRMGQIIEDMLNLSRVTRNEMAIQSVNLSILFKDIADNFCQSQQERNVDIVIEPDIVVNGDTNLLRIALENLFGNAWKFTSHHIKARIEFGMQKHQDEMRYFIKDDGAGFNMNYSKKIFSPFQRLHTSAEFSGTGVGLAIVQRIINRHGGKIWAEGKIEKGAVFYFTIP